MVKAFRSGHASAALKLHEKYYALFRDLFLETNPVPVKAALAMAGLIEEELRLPLLPLGSKNRAVLKATLAACGCGVA
jgi:4-hydroxy-tetrahydrodipicolinate synthase